MVYYSPTPALLSELTYLAGLADWEARAVELALTHCYRGVPLFVLVFSLNSKLALGFISQGRLFLIHLVFYLASRKARVDSSTSNQL
jgi:hypothetical protein